MRTQHKARFLITKVALGPVLLVTLVSGCTRPRDPRIIDDKLNEQIVAISDIQGDGFNLTLGDQAPAASVKDRALIQSQKPVAPIAKTDVPAKIRSAVYKAQLQGQPGQSYPLSLKVEMQANTGFVTGYRVITNTNELTPLEKQLAKQVGGAYFLPSFKITILKKGILRRSKNENGEETSRLELYETPPEQATHVLLDLDKGAVPVSISVDDTKSQQEIFSADQLQNRILNGNEVTKIFQSNEKGGEEKLDNKKKYILRMGTDPKSASSVLLHIYEIKKRGDLVDVLKRQLDAKVNTLEVLACSKEVLTQLSKAEVADCVMERIGDLSGAYVTASLETKDGLGTSNISFQDAKDRSTGIVRISANQVLSPSPEEAKRRLDPSYTLQIKDIKGKEFFLRRTFEDGSVGMISAMGIGMSGRTDLVKFELEEKRLVVRRVHALNGDNKADVRDKEELMSIPAAYYKTTDKNGVALKDPVTVKDPNQADVVVIDWTNNRLPVINSPLGYLDGGSCFVTTSFQDVTDLDMQLDKGLLNFSINGTYAVAPDCLTAYRLNDYGLDQSVQGAYNLKERISFQVNNGRTDQFHSINLPPRAQNLFGFGAFTNGQLIQDIYGNTDSPESEISHPIVHDFTNGRKLIYVLGGDIRDEKLKAATERAAKKVVQNWNSALHKAFQGTKLDRSDDYIELKIEGVDIPKGHLGDLNRNYIWNMDRNFNGGPLGIAQPTANFRTGVIKATNVIMYTGNMMSYTGYNIESAKIKRQYQLMRQGVYEEMMKRVQAAGDVLPDTARSTPSAANNSSAEAKTTTNKNLLTKLNQTLSSTGRESKNQFKMGTSSRAKSVLSQLLNEQGDDESSFLPRLAHKILDNKKILNDQYAMEAMIASELAKSPNSRAVTNLLGKQDPEKLKEEAFRAQLVSRFVHGFLQGPNCLLEANDLSIDGNIDLKDPYDVFENLYTWALTHEMGHTLGLTHNFKGSFDKNNFLFEGEKAEREGSTVMDYIDTSITAHAGPGPYDVHAIRAIYTGLVELSQPDQDALKNQNATSLKLTGTDANGKETSIGVPLYNQKYLQLQDVQKILLSGKSWWNVSPQDVSSLPVHFKSYLYCSDYDVGEDPSCARFDHGTTYEELANFYINEYKDAYPLSYYRGDRKTFTNPNRRIARLIRVFKTIRQFLDEYVYQMHTRQLSPIQNTEGERYCNNYQKYRDTDSNRYYVCERVALGSGAATSAYKFFLELLGTPDVRASAMSPNRFGLTPFDVPEMNEKGEPTGKLKRKWLLTEIKPTTSLFQPGSDTELDTIGIELDKVFAMILLTRDSLGMYRYEKASIHSSFVDFETDSLKIATSDSMVLRLLQGFMEDNITGILYDNENNVVYLSKNFHATATPTLRSYSVIAAALNLDISTLEDRFNMATNFYVNSTMKAPANKIVVSKRDLDLKSETTPKIWAFDNATIAKQMVVNAARKRVVLDNEKKIKDLFEPILGARDDKQSKESIDHMASELKAMDSQGLLVPESIKQKELGLEKYIASIAAYVFDLNNFLTNEILPKGKKLTQDDLRMLNQKRDEILLLTRDDALYEPALTTLLNFDPYDKNPIARNFIDILTNNGMNNAISHGLTVSSLEELARVIFILHPELTK